MQCSHCIAWPPGFASQPHESQAKSLRLGRRRPARSGSPSQTPPSPLLEGIQSSDDDDVLLSATNTVANGHLAVVHDETTTSNADFLRTCVGTHAIGTNDRRLEIRILEQEAC